jgi:penicillin-binding protein 2
MRNKKRTISVLTYLSLTIMSIFLLRLYQLQVLKGDYYLAKSEKNKVRVFKIPASRGIIYDRNGIALVKNSPYFIASLIPDLSGRAINLTELSKLLNISVEDLSEKIIRHGKNSLEPIRLKKDLSFREVAIIEARRSDFPGLIIETEVTRTYPFGNTAAHLIGYLSLPTEEQLRRGLFKEIPPGTFVGQWGVEALYDEKLRGAPGKRFVEIDALGRQIRNVKIVPPQRGDDITLSIDIRTQSAAEKAFKGRSGALMALDPNNGEVLALVSLPSFDPNLFARGIAYKHWKRLKKHPGHPLLNRVLQSQYPPGSIFKIVTAVAALEEGIIDRDFKVNCTGKINVGPWRFSCWKEEGHGVVDIKKAIIESCDVYFYEIGRLLGIDRIAKYAKALGFGAVSGLNLCSEKEGIIPNRYWKLKTKGRPWYLGETFNASIGQGYVSVTPAQAALMISAIANGGMIYSPVLIKSYKNREPALKISLKAETLSIIRESLSGVVEHPKGTARQAQSELTRIAGKTGTAQVIRMGDSDKKSSKHRQYRDHAWFVAYAPEDHPLIALSVLVEHGGHGGVAAVPIAKRTIEEYIRGNVAE